MPFSNVGLTHFAPVIALHTAIKELEDEIENPDSILNRTGADKKKELGLLVNNCMSVLQQLNKLLVKYKSLGTGTKRAWDRLRWGSENVQEIRDKLMVHTASLTLFLTTLGTGSLGRIEKKLDELIVDVRAGRKAETVLSMADEDEDESRAQWELLKGELVEEGLTTSEVESHKNWIMAKLLERIGDLEEQAQPVVSSSSNPAPSRAKPNASQRVEQEKAPEDEGIFNTAPLPPRTQTSLESLSLNRRRKYRATVRDVDENGEEILTLLESPPAEEDIPEFSTMSSDDIQKTYMERFTIDGTKRSKTPGRNKIFGDTESETRGIPAAHERRTKPRKSTIEEPTPGEGVLWFKDGLNKEMASDSEDSAPSDWLESSVSVATCSPSDSASQIGLKWSNNDIRDSNSSQIPSAPSSSNAKLPMRCTIPTPDNQNGWSDLSPPKGKHLIPPRATGSKPVLKIIEEESSKDSEDNDSYSSLNPSDSDETPRVSPPSQRQSQQIPVNKNRRADGRQPGKAQPPSSPLPRAKSFHSRKHGKKPQTSDDDLSRYDPDCAICLLPASAQCKCESMAFDLSVWQSEQRTFNKCLENLRLVFIYA
jgi:hypothetical protein